MTNSLKHYNAPFWILIVEDDVWLAELVREYLLSHEFEV